MVFQCSVRGCRNESFPGCGFSFHNFPKDEVVKQQWLKVVPLKNLQYHHKVCSKHFPRSDFIIRGASVRLNKNAVPSIAINGIVPINAGSGNHAIVQLSFTKDSFEDGEESEEEEEETEEEKEKRLEKELKNIRNKINHMKEKQNNMKRELMRYKVMLKSQQAALKVEKRKYKKLKQKVNKMKVMKQEVGSEEKESEDEKKSTSEEEDTETETEQDTESESEPESGPLPKKKGRKFYNAVQEP